ncbi:ABC transporter ATP-binding protein [Pseudohalocynthiibacter sp. F2068]|uniref:ABC transporter ATP-binding protein n=1 Tax=Pseudohalocynthiibacter sp. F2068 TaxID=2926418 RepID=UPI001FF1B022|nr:ABC transporter ATP-binding protein [Pseudohalocynthiibacter sp. F2068]MCK0104584.1 ABC transporter ATP-binding protein [Pseudohalocynthiibacter sp. F2068]
MTQPILRIQNLTKNFGGLTAVNDLSLELGSGVVHAIIGPNGAGKTTLFNLISGFLPSTSGTVWFDGQDVTRMRTHLISQLGLARTLQIKSVFSSMTVEENVWIAVQSRGKVFDPFSRASSLKDTQRRTDEVLEQTDLSRLAKRTAGTLSYGDVALLEIGIALATSPKMLLLDEPVCGMSPAETDQTVRRVSDLSKSVDIVIIEHDMEVVFGLSDHITVMAQGAVLAEGTPSEIQANEKVRIAYLGEDDDDQIGAKHA